MEPSLWVPPQEAATALVSVQPLGQEVDGVLAATQRGRVKTQTSEKRRLQAGVLTVAGARGTRNFVCWKLTPQCVVSVDGTSLLGSDHARSRRALALTVSILSTR